jgi:hypothetical protein
MKKCIWCEKEISDYRYNSSNGACFDCDTLWGHMSKNKFDVVKKMLKYVRYEKLDVSVRKDVVKSGSTISEWEEEFEEYCNPP